MSVQNALIGGGVGVGATVLTSFVANAATGPDFTRPWWREPEVIAVGAATVAGVGALAADHQGRIDLSDTLLGGASGLAAGGATLLTFAALLNADVIPQPRFTAPRISA